MSPEPPVPPRQPALSGLACRLLAGLDTATFPALFLAVWFPFHSWLRGEYWWSKLNLLALPLYGERVYQMGFSRATLAGLALLLLLYAALGALFALFARPRGFALNLLLALLTGLSFHWLAHLFLWPRLDSSLSYFPPVATLPGHLIFSLALTRFPSRLAAVSLAFGEPAWAARFVPQLEPPSEPTPEAPSSEAEPSAPLEPAPLPEASSEDPSAAPAPPAEPSVCPQPSAPAPVETPILLGPATPPEPSPTASPAAPPTPSGDPLSPPQDLPPSPDHGA